jgi:hypothetical protein
MVSDELCSGFIDVAMPDSFHISNQLAGLPSKRRQNSRSGLYKIMCRAKLSIVEWIYDCFI